MECEGLWDRYRNPRVKAREKTSWDLERLERMLKMTKRLKWPI